VPNSPGERTIQLVLQGLYAPHGSLRVRCRPLSTWVIPPTYILSMETRTTSMASAELHTARGRKMPGCLPVLGSMGVWRAIWGICDRQELKSHGMHPTLHLPVRHRPMIDEPRMKPKSFRTKISGNLQVIHIYRYGEALVG